MRIGPRAGIVVQLWQRGDAVTETDRAGLCAAHQLRHFPYPVDHEAGIASHELAGRCRVILPRRRIAGTEPVRDRGQRALTGGPVGELAVRHHGQALLGQQRQPQPPDRIGALRRLHRQAVGGSGLRQRLLLDFFAPTAARALP